MNAGTAPPRPALTPSAVCPSIHFRSCLPQIQVYRYSSSVQHSGVERLTVEFAWGERCKRGEAGQLLGVYHASIVLFLPMLPPTAK